MKINTALKRVALWFQIRAIEATIDGQTTCLACVENPALLNRIEIARHNARRERARLIGERAALLPIERRRSLNYTI